MNHPCIENFLALFWYVQLLVYLYEFGSNIQLYTGQN